MTVWLIQKPEGLPWPWTDQRSMFASEDREADAAELFVRLLGLKPDLSRKVSLGPETAAEILEREGFDFHALAECDPCCAECRQWLNEVHADDAVDRHREAVK